MDLVAFDLLCLRRRALIVRMKTTTHTAERAQLFWDEAGRVECREHTPAVGSDTWNWGDLQPITRAEALAFERDVGRAPACETCAAIARRA